MIRMKRREREKWGEGGSEVREEGSKEEMKRKGARGREKEGKMTGSSLRT